MGQESARIFRSASRHSRDSKHPTLAQSHPDRPLVLYSAPADVSASTIARLVSVVEIIKREYLKGRDVSAGDVSGLHQYNQLLSEQQGRIPLEESEDRRDALHLALDGHSQCVHAVLQAESLIRIAVIARSSHSRHT